MIWPGRDYTQVSGSIIPSKDRRWCGCEFKDDAYYLKSAEGEANRLVEYFQCSPASRILDVGCGQGRLPIGLLRVIGAIDYTGLDVDNKSIDWCRRYIESDNPSFSFKHLDFYNERYHTKGMKIDDHFRFEIESKSMDIVYLYSVFSHTTEKDLRIYLNEFSRILDKDGKIFFTTFVEEDVPNISINPNDYRLKCKGPLHIVRYRKAYLFSLIDAAGYAITAFTHATEADGQSAIYLRRKNG